MKNTIKGMFMQGIYSVPIIGDIIGKTTDDYFYKLSNFVSDAMLPKYADAIDKWVSDHPHDILTNKKVREIIKSIKDI